MNNCKKKVEKPKEKPICLKIRKAVMEETLDFLKQMRIELEQKQTA